MPENYKQIPTMLAILTKNGDYSYIDRLAYAASKDLALFYLKEALRGFHAIKRNPPKEIRDNKDLMELIEELDNRWLDTEIDRIENECNNTRKLREALSLICAKALARSTQFIKKGE